MKRQVAWCLSLAIGLLSMSAFAEDRLPTASAFKGEIRRGADGKLVVQPETDAEAQVRHMPVREPTMIVGPQERITTITEAARRARDGEVIEIRPGNYYGQPAIWSKNNIVIRASDSRPVMHAAGKSAEEKAIWVVRGQNVLIENIEFRGARVPDGNGAGIRFESGSLTLRRCAFFDNEMGLLTANGPEATLEIADSEFGEAPLHAGSLHHLLYVGQIGKFTVSGSRFEQGYLGHLIKSRARENHIRYNRLVDGKGGRASYELELPNGGLAFVIGNVIGQGAGTDNPLMVAYGAEGPRWSENALYFIHNTLVNDVQFNRPLKLWQERFAEPVDLWLINNLVVGHGGFDPPSRGRIEGNTVVARAEMLEDAGVPARLAIRSGLRGSVRLPGEVRGLDLRPVAEFNAPVGSQPIMPGSRLAPGAFQ